MTELETMQRAKMYLDKLANGINPLTDQPAAEGDCINQVRISRCLFYVSDVLRKVIENGGNIGKAEKVKKQAFAISHEALKNFRLSAAPIPVSEITNRINELIDESVMNKLKYTSITTFLLQSGFLTQTETGDGKKKKVPTKQGLSIGIASEERVYQSGTHHVTVYHADAQQFILDNVEAVIEINNRKPVTKTDRAEYQGQPWTSNYDETLIDLFHKNVPVSEIAIMKLVTYEDTSMPYAEERRLFYVALTRTKNRVYIMTPQHKPSRFLIELIKENNLSHSDKLNTEVVDLFHLRCPVCGFPLKYEFNKTYGLSLWICTNEVEVCDFMTNDKVHKHDIFKCPKCKDGYMIVRMNRKNGNVFYGCTNYYNSQAQCKNMIPLPNDPA